MPFSGPFRVLQVGIVLLAIGNVCRASRPPPLRPGQLRRFDLTITKQWMDPYGIARDLLVANGQFPGPHLEINEGEEVEITVHNKLDVNTTIHWHGSS